MWENSRIINNKLYHPFLWPQWVIGSIVLLYFVAISAFYFLYTEALQDPGKDLYEKALEIRRQELTNIKLTGAEPYVWKPLFKCESLHQKQQREKQVRGKGNGECIVVSFSFLDEKSAAKAGRGVAAAGVMNQYIYGENHEVRYLEETPAPCTICHQKKTAGQVLWTYQYKVEKPSSAIVQLWQSRDFLYFNAFFWSLILLYYIIKVIFRLNGGNDLIAVAVKSGNEAVLANVLTGAWRVERRMFVYIEVAGNTMSGYIPRRYLLKLYKKYFTGEFQYSDLDLRIGVVEFNAVSFEGLRIAQAVANKAAGSTVIVQDKVISSRLLPEMKRAVLKRKDSELYFNVMDI